MANFPGGQGALPGTYVDTVTASRGLSIPGGSRIAALIGEGLTSETLVIQAIGGGKDGLDPTYTSTSGADGRHFQLSIFPVIENRTQVFKNGVRLNGVESTIDSNPFSFKYDYRFDPSTGRIELQQAHLLDQGGSFWTELSTNVGDGYLSNLTLLDADAFNETWSIRCVGVQRNSSNQPIQGTAKFLAYGSISGQQLDANGNPIVWVADGYVVSNGVLSFAIYETQVGNVATSVFREGDAFTVKVTSGVLARNDSLTANYIPTSYLNDPVLLQGLGDVVKRHGLPSVDNNLALGAQLAFANAAPAVLTVQAAPAMPRRQSYVMENAVNSLSTNDDDFIFPFPLGVTPDPESNIHFFVRNNATNVETQLLPNKLDFYTLDTAGYPTTNQFIRNNTVAPSGYSYFYTVVKSYEALSAGEDGYIGRITGFTHKGVFSSSTRYDASYVGETLKIIDAENVANIGEYTVDNVIDGKLYVTYSGQFPDFTNQSSVGFELINPATGSVVPGSSGANGVITANVGLESAILSSASINFTNFVNITDYKLKISGTAANDGLYDVSLPTGSGPWTITITKAVVNEPNMRFEVLDIDDQSDYLVINQNVVPNGYGLRVSIVDSKDASFYDSGWLNALESLEAFECDIVVPLPKQTISVIFQNALNHCKTMSNIRNRRERILFIGAINGLTPENLTGVDDAAVEDIGTLEGIQGDSITEVLANNVEDLANYSVADAFGNTYRCVYFYPDQIVVNAGGQNVLMDGFYIAAAAAGYESADVRLENPLTNKVLSGFTILRNKQFSQLTLEQLAGAGVTTLQPVAGGGRVVWGITTSQSGFPEEQEISVVFIRDRVAKTLRAGFSGFIGTPEDTNTQAVLNTRAVLILNSLVSQKLIKGFRDLSVKRDEVLPTQFNITVRVEPVYPVNFIYIRVEVGQL